MKIFGFRSAVLIFEWEVEQEEGRVYAKDTAFLTPHNGLYCPAIWNAFNLTVFSTGMDL